jgi:glycosyltransferase involved in cell wall biosynthesis
MTPGKLSVIIPFAQEHPQVAFTVQAIFCELRDKCDFEIIVIDNHCDELQAQLDKQGNQRDKGGEYMKSLAGGPRPWLKYLTYDVKLSHWQAKNAGVAASDGEFFWFVDSHCVPSQGSLIDMFNYYKGGHKELNGTLHMPLAYMLEKPGLELIYRLVTDAERGVVHYSFTRYRSATTVYQVPCMSTCGMMMSREIYDKLGGWPTELGIYGGGEHFINFTLAIMGMTINIYPTNPLYHYAAPRGYHWLYTDYHRNRCIATYMFGGEQWAYRYIMNIKPHGAEHNAYKESLYSTVAGSKACIKHRQLIQSRQTKTIATWLQEQMINLPADMIDSMPVEN